MIYMGKDDRRCEPYICPFPPPEEHEAGDLWNCPNCGARYRLSEPVWQSWDRSWYAPNGRWVLRWSNQLRYGLGVESTCGSNR